MGSISPLAVASGCGWSSGEGGMSDVWPDPHLKAP
jgi:hypothetical protein